MEQLTRRSRGAAVPCLLAGHRNKFMHSLRVGSWMLGEQIVECCRISQESLAPLLDTFELACCSILLLSVSFQRRANFLGVDLAHQLADVLTLAQLRSVARDAPRSEDGVTQALGQRQRLKQRFGQIDELLAELLQIL